MLSAGAFGRLAQTPTSLFLGPRRALVAGDGDWAATPYCKQYGKAGGSHPHFLRCGRGLTRGSLSVLGEHREWEEKGPKNKEATAACCMWNDRAESRMLKIAIFSSPPQLTCRSHLVFMVARAN